MIVIVEIAEKALNDRTLFVDQITDVVEFVKVTDIGKDMIGISPVFVDIIEIGKEELSPAVEVV